MITHKTHLKIAFSLWAIVGTGLLSAGGILLTMGQEGFNTGTWLGLAVALILGYFKGKFMLTKIGRKNINRIFNLPEASPLYSTFSPRSWILILLMIAIGRTIRFLGASPTIVGVIYVAVGLALLIGSRTYLSAAADAPDKGPDCPLPEKTV